MAAIDFGPGHLTLTVSGTSATTHPPVQLFTPRIIRATAPTPNVTSSVSGAGIMSFGGIGFTATANVRNNAVGLMSFSGVSFVSSAAKTETGVGVLSFQGIHFVAAAAVIDVVGVGVMHFGGLTFHASTFIPTPAGTGLRQFWTT
jgi:hypothetical protein